MKAKASTAMATWTFLALSATCGPALAQTPGLDFECTVQVAGQAPTTWLVAASTSGEAEQIVVDKVKSEMPSASLQVTCVSR